MFGLIRRLIGLAIIIGLIFIALSLWKGGTPFRWLGQESEKAGVVIKKKSEEMGEKADEIKKKTDSVQGTTKKVAEGIRKAGDKVRDVTGLKDDK
ncbi:MAG TPA: hypothetical protein VK435_06705 [Thermodesulfovibrionales bacterium]|nr:hypothetical protein [Thermodesulfovibrionales bacterium]